jgi:hypothetical protein
VAARFTTRPIAEVIIAEKRTGDAAVRRTRQMLAPGVQEGPASRKEDNMADSMSPDSKKRLPDEDGPQRDVTPTTGINPDDLGNPERGTRPTDASLTGEHGAETPEHVHQRRLRDSGSASPEDSGNAVPELAGDDESLLKGNPPGMKPM